MSIISLIQKTFPNMSTYALEDIAKLREPRFLMSGDILHWVDLRGQINAKTGRINSYRDIRKITAAEGGKVPSLGTLRNYLGEGGEIRVEIAKAEWRGWFEDFGRVTQWYKEEMEGLTTPAQWKEFRVEYALFMGY